MRFKVQHTIRNISLADYERLYFDEEFNDALCRHVKLSRQVVQRNVTDARIVRVVKVGPDREIPAPAAKILGGNKIEYTEHLEYDFGAYKGNWHTVSSLLTDKVDSRGTFGFEEAAGGVRRVVEGEIKVKIFGIGGVVEKFIVADVEKSYEDAYRFTQEWIDSGKLAPAS